MSKLKIGDNASVNKIFTNDEVKFYCERISHDENPIHFDNEAAKKSGFEGCLVPGPMISCLFGGLLGSRLPGDNTIFLGQETRFLKPVYINEKITAEIRIIKIREDKPIATFSTVVTKENGEIAVNGTAIVKFKK